MHLSTNTLHTSRLRQFRKYVSFWTGHVVMCDRKPAVAPLFYFFYLLFAKIICRTRWKTSLKNKFWGQIFWKWHSFSIYELEKRGNKLSYSGYVVLWLEFKTVEEISLTWCVSTLFTCWKCTHLPQLILFQLYLVNTNNLKILFTQEVKITENDFSWPCY